MQNEGRIEKISPGELHAVFTRMRAECWNWVFFLGPRTRMTPPPHRAGPKIVQLSTLPESSIDFSLAGPALRGLFVWELDIGDEGATAIARSLTGLTSLDLWSNNIGDEGATAIARSLTGLTSLDLRSNNIGDEGANAIARSLTKLTSLDLRSNNIGNEGATAIARSLTGLRSLGLSDNKIGDEGAIAITRSLTGLTSLDLSDSKISDEGATAIAQSLTGLTSLGLRSNKIRAEGAIAIARSLTGLESLYLSRNNIGDEGAIAIALSLTDLTSLDLWANNIGDEGATAIARSLTDLTSLDLAFNNIGDESATAIAQSLTKLTSLDLSHNNIGDEGAIAIARYLTKLTSLNLSESEVGNEGAIAIAQSLTGLTSLHLSTSGIGVEGATIILDAYSARGEQLRELALNDNGDLSNLLPSEALETTDAQAILAAYRRFKSAREDNNARPLDEVKLIVVGNEAVGKTSLLRFLIEGKPRDLRGEKRTAGIRQHEKIATHGWSPQNSNVRINIWDFGGQEVMRGTHRYFLTDRCLYLLVLEDRRQDDLSVYDWMKTIRNRGTDSPVIVVINKSDDGKSDYRPDETGLKATYPNIVTFLRASCDPDEWAKNSIAALREQIVATIESDPRLKHVHQPFPRSYLVIRDRLRDMARDRALMTQANFAALCTAPGEAGVEPITDEDEQRALLRLLHDLGVVVAHGLTRDASAAEREVTLLDPNWLTDAIYRILEMTDSDAQRGVFARAKLDEWLDPARYPSERHEYILSMMQNKEIGLCFRLPLGAGAEAYLAPEALPKSQPEHMRRWATDSLCFRYRYSFLPPGLMPRFIVEAHEHIAGGTRWRGGVVLRACDCEALVIADRDGRKIDISIDGPENRRRDALNVVLTYVEKVHAINPESEPVACVPLPDLRDADVLYEYLLTLEKEEGADYVFRPEKAGAQKYRVYELLGGVRRDPHAELVSKVPSSRARAKAELPRRESHSAPRQALIRWLHVSDFHFKSGDPYDRDVVLSALVAAVKHYRDEEGLGPDVIFATGDIAQSGERSEYEPASDFFDALCTAAGVDKRRLFVVPGNHDVDRRLGLGLTRTLSSQKEADAYFEPSLPKPHLTQKQAAFLEWHNHYFDGVRQFPATSTCAVFETLHINGYMLGVLPLNSALFCQDDNDHAKLWLGRRCLEGAVKALQAQTCDLKIALLHHPLDWFHDVERTNVRALLQDNVDVILRGHLHDADVEKTIGVSGEALHIVAGASYQTREWPNRAFYCAYDGAEIDVFPIRYEDSPRPVWTVDAALFPHDPDHRRRFRVNR